MRQVTARLRALCLPAIVLTTTFSMPALADVLAPRPDDRPEPGPCDVRALEAFDRCVEEGGVLDRCREEAAAAAEECRRLLDQCHERCTLGAEQVALECAEAGGSREQCEERREHFLRGCLADCARPGELECHERCREAGGVAFHRCVEVGGTEDECVEVARRVVEGCRRDCEAPPECASACELRVEERRRLCLASGGTVEDCEERLRAELRDCLERCARPPCVVGLVPRPSLRVPSTSILPRR